LKLTGTGIHTRTRTRMKNPPKTRGYTPTRAIHYGLVQMFVSPQYGGHFVNQDLLRVWAITRMAGTSPLQDMEKA